VGRHLPPRAFTHNTHLQLPSKLLLDVRSDILSPPATSTTPSTPPNDDDETNEADRDIGLALPASDELWYKHMRKGNSLDCGMRGTDIGAGYQLEDTRTPPSAASPWVGGLTQLVDWYWQESSFDSRICNMDVYWGMGTMFQALGISPRSTADGGDLQCFQLRHKDEHAKYPDGTPRGALAQSYVMDGKMYHVREN